MSQHIGMDYSDYEWKMGRELLTNVLEHGMAAPNSVVLCLGGGTVRTAREIYHAGLPNTQVIAVNCDEEALKNAEADKKLLVGRTVTFGKDAGGFSEVGEHCFDMAEEEIREAMYGSDVVYIVATMGGGFATGFAPKTARAAKEDGRVVVSLIFTPFSFEDRNDTVIQEAIHGIRYYSDSTVVTSNDDLMFKPNMTVTRAFNIMDRLVVDTIRDTSQSMDNDLLLSVLEEELPQIMSRIAELTAPSKPEPVKEETETNTEEVLVAV